MKNKITQTRYWYNRLTGAIGTEATSWVVADPSDGRARFEVDGEPYMWAGTGAPWIDEPATRQLYGVEGTEPFVLPFESEFWDGPAGLVPLPGWVEIPERAHRAIVELLGDSSDVTKEQVESLLLKLGFDPAKAEELKRGMLKPPVAPDSGH